MKTNNTQRQLIPRNIVDPTIIKTQKPLISGSFTDISHQQRSENDHPPHPDHFMNSVIK